MMMGVGRRRWEWAWEKVVRTDSDKGWSPKISETRMEARPPLGGRRREEEEGGGRRDKRGGRREGGRVSSSRMDRVPFCIMPEWT